MRLSDLLEQKEDETTEGTYAGYRLDTDSEEALMEAIKSMNIPNPVSQEDLHITLLYSRKFLPDYEPAKDTNIIVTPSKFTIFDGQDGSKVLVLILDCGQCIDRHIRLMAYYDATYDFPEYIPHITLSYDIGDYSLEDANMNFDKLPTSLLINSEYMEKLEFDWKNS